MTADETDHAVATMSSDTQAAIGQLVRRADVSFDEFELSVIDDIGDNGIAETERVGRPSSCPACGRDPKRMEIVDTRRESAETYLTYECRCGTETEAAARGDSAGSYYSAAPEWEARLIEQGWTEAELGTLAPFYFIDARTPKGVSALESFGVLAGPLPTFRAAAAVKERYQKLDAQLFICSRDEHEVPECRICGKRVVPSQASEATDGHGNVVDYTCGKCFQQEWGGVFSALADFTGAESIL